MQTLLYGAWAALYLLCTALGLFLKEPGTLAGVLSLLFFLPPIILILKGTKKDRTRILLLSAASLFLTVLCILGAGLTAHPESRVLGFFTAAVSCPMATAFSWVQSLFLWACLLFGCVVKRK